MAAEERPFTLGKLGLSDRELFEIRTEQIKKRNEQIRSFLGSRGLAPFTQNGLANFIHVQAQAAVSPQVADIPLAEKISFADRYEAGAVGYLVSSLYKPSLETLSYGEFIQPIPELAQTALFAATLKYGDDALVDIRKKTGGQSAPQNDAVPGISGPIFAFFEQQN